MKLISLFLFLSLQVHAHDLRVKNNLVDGFSRKRADSGIFGPKYVEQVKNMKRLATGHKGIHYINYGTSVKGKPLSGLLFIKNARSVQQLVIITGATHGNEYLNIVDRLPEALMKSENQALKKFLELGGSVFFVPILNPDGYDARRRANANGYDLNRDWPNPYTGNKPSTQPENIALSNWIEKYVEKTKANVSLVVDYHCCVRGALLLPWAYKKGEYMADADAQRSKEFQKIFKESFKKPGSVGTPPDILYSAVGTTLDYWYDKYTAISFTYEGRYRTEKDLLDSHVKWWERSFKKIYQMRK